MQTIGILEYARVHTDQELMNTGACKLGCVQLHFAHLNVIIEEGNIALPCSLHIATHALYLSSSPQAIPHTIIWGRGYIILAEVKV